MSIHRLYCPFLRYFRTRRIEAFRCAFGLTKTTRVLDVGGVPFNWSLINGTLAGQHPGVGVRSIR